MQAGLFSASLTAFLVESYKMLQEDNSDTSKQYLARISVQLESFKLSSGFVNATRTPPPPATLFQPSDAAVWINSLWFLSLMFTLSAAFFGIRVRQWLREYMRWNDALANPRENVLVRQVRFVALNDWKVLGSISFIPALLELALVLFVSGIVVLTWTLNSTVATIASTAVALLLFVTLIITVLPICCKRCPYRSPTAWACLFLWSYIRDTITLVYWRNLWMEAHICRDTATNDADAKRPLLSYMKENIHTVSWVTSHPKSWRFRDMQSVYVEEMPDEMDQMRVTSAVVDAEVMMEMEELKLRNSVGQPAKIIEWREREEIMWDMGQTLWLFRALIWVMQSSEDPRIHRHAIKCTETIHPPATGVSPYHPACWPQSYVADLYLLTRPWMPASVPRYAAYLNSSYPNVSNIATLRSFLRMWFEPCSRALDPSSAHKKDHRLLLAAKCPGHFLLASPFNVGLYEEKLMMHIFAADLIRLIAHCLPSSGTEYGRSGAERIFELTTMLFLLNECAPDAASGVLARVHNALEDYTSRTGHKLPGITPALFEGIYASGAFGAGYPDLDEHGKFTGKFVWASVLSH